MKLVHNVTDFTADLTAFTKRAGTSLLINAGEVSGHKSLNLRAAAVLVPIVVRPKGLSVLLTQRSDEMPTHAGQVSFPGGKIEPGDGSPLAAALRETFEETGIEQNFVEPLGYLESFATGTGFTIVPVVGAVAPGFTLNPEPGEVAAIFEVPLKFLMDPDNHQKKQAVWRGKNRKYHVIPYQDRKIWGATAGILIDLYNRMSRYD